MCQLKTRRANTTHNQQCVFTRSRVTAGRIYKNVAFFYFFIFLSKEIQGEDVQQPTIQILTAIKRAISPSMPQCQILFSFRIMVFNSNKRLKTRKWTPDLYLRFSWSVSDLLDFPIFFPPEGVLTCATVRTHKPQPVPNWHYMSFHMVSCEMPERNLVMFWSNLRSFHKTKNYTIELLVTTRFLPCLVQQKQDLTALLGNSESGTRFDTEWFFYKKKNH